MAYGFIVEKKINASDIDALNNIATCATNVDGGNLVTYGAYAQGVWTVTLAGANAGTGLGMAYNPTEHLTVVNGKYFSGLSADPRDYTNLANRPFDVFHPVAGDIIGFTTANITGNAPVVNDVLTTAANGVLTVNAAPTAGTTQFKVLAVENLPFPQAGIGLDYQPLYVCECMAN
jgi:hypothetical protein